MSIIKQTFKVPDMTCPNCVMRLEGIEDELPGVKQVNASYHKLQMVVEFDEAQVSVEQIIVAARKKGYHPILA